MKLKLTALSLAILPTLAVASIEHGSDKSPKHKADSVIVVYKDSASKLQRRSVRSQLGAQISDLNRDEVDDRFRNILKGRVAQYKLNGRSVKDALAALNKNPAVLYAEPDYIVQPAVTPDDSLYDELWGLHNTGQTGGVNDADIDAPEAWETSVGSRDVVIGVIDTGVDYNHPDLAANMWVNPGEIAGDGVDNDGNGYIDDVHGINAIDSSGDPMDTGGHGTHVSGTIGATGNNAEGVVGVNHEVSIIGCKFLGAEGGSTSDAIECINYFVGLKQQGVDVRATNNSWGGGGYSQALADALTASEEANILFIAAAGNDAYDNDATASYPSGYSHESVMGIASTTHTDAMSGFSQWGLTTIDMGAPGSAILSTTPGNSYSTYSGTSMATPHVTGAAALAWSVNPELTALEMKALLMNSGDDNAALMGKTVSGKRLNVNNALLDADPTPGFKMSVTPANQTIVAGDTATYTFDVGSIADWSGVVSLTLEDSLGGASLSTDSVSPGESFTLSVPTNSGTNWGDYSFTVTATSGELVKTSTVGLYVNPQGLQDVTYTNNTSVDIPDNDQTGITSTINVQDPITVFGHSSYINITHTYIGDLTVTLTSPAGTSAVLHGGGAGGSADDIDQSFATDAFNGEVATGDWTLSVVDGYGADVGTLNNWSMTISALGEVLPAAPEASFSSEVDSLTVTFTDTSSDANNDIVSWDWDFGDGSMSTDQNPIHTFSDAGEFEVTLTVTDSEGLSSTTSSMVSVSTDNITAELKRAYKSRFGRLRIDFTYDGSSAEMVDIYRNGSLYDTVENTGIYRDRERRATESSYTYKVCNAGTPACSNEITASF